MLGKIKAAFKNYIRSVVAEEKAKDTKEQQTPKRPQRDFGADISSMDMQKKNIAELLNLSFQKSAKDFTVTYNGKKQVAMDSVECQMATPAVDMTGTAKDILYTFFAKFGFIGWQQCALLAQHWLISNACSIPAKDAIRNGWINTFADADKEETTGEEKEKEQKFLNELNEITNTKYKLSEKLIQWITKYNIYGIGIALPKIDGIDYEKPYNPDGIKKGAFKGIAIIDPYWLTPQFEQDVMTDPTHPNFYKPTHYLTADGKKIHASHFIIIRRKEVPDILKPSYYFGGIPLTQEIYERVYAAEKSANEQPLLLLTKRVNGWKVDLNEFFLDPKKYEERIKNFTDKRDNQGVLLIDHEDDMFQIDTTLSDLDQVVMSQYKLVAAVARIPVDKLFELNPSGTLSNSGDFNIKNYTQDLNSIQNDLDKPFIDRINEIVMRSYYGRKDRIAIVFNPTDNPTAQEQATNVKTEVDTLQALIGNNVITTEEARQKLIADKRNGFSFLDEEAPEQEQDNAEIEQMMAQMKGGNGQNNNNNNNNNNNGQQNNNVPPKQQGKDEDIAEDTEWITVHPHGNKEAKGQPVPVEEGQGKGEAIKQHFARAAAGETHMYNDNDDDDDLDFSFNPEVIEEQEELEKKNKELEKEHKKEAAKAKREQKKWEKMSEEEKDAERNEWYESEQKREKQAKKEMPQKTLPEVKKELEDMGITEIRRPTENGYGKERWEEFNALSPRIKRYFFTDSDAKYGFKWDEANHILEKHGTKEQDIFEYLRVVDIKTPQSRTNERTRNYLKGEKEEPEQPEIKVTPQMKKDIKETITVGGEPFMLGEFIDKNNKNKKEIENFKNFLQEEYEVTGKTLKDALMDIRRISDLQDYEGYNDLINSTINQYIDRQKEIIKNTKQIKRQITSDLSPEEFLKYLAKEDTGLGAYWSINKAEAVEYNEQNQDHKYLYTFVGEPSIDNIDIGKTLNVRAILEDTEDEIRLKKAGEIKLVGLLDKDGKEIKLPKNIQNRMYKVNTSKGILSQDSMQQAEDRDYNRDEFGRFAKVNSSKNDKKENNIQPEIEIDNKEFNEKLNKAQTTKITKKYKDYREVEKNLRALANKDIKNNDTGSVAQINNAQRDKLVSNRAVEKSNNNGFSREEHLSAAAEIKQLYEKAIFKGKRKDEDNNNMFIKRFVAPVDFGDKKAYAKITAKETIIDGERIYSVELHSLEQIGKKEAFDNWE